jgi:hypothetical protein
MNPQPDVTSALASLLSILSQSSQQSHPQPYTPPPLYPPRPSTIEPVFIDDTSVVDTTQWIGVPTTTWREPENWRLPPRKSPQSPSLRPVVQPVDPPPAVVAPATYSQALTLVIQKSQSNEFLLHLQGMKRRQHDLEEDLFEARCRIQRKYESKRKMNQLLRNLGSEHADEQVLPKLTSLISGAFEGGE